MALHSPDIPSDLFERYLSLLGVRKQAPSARALGEIVQAHVVHVPFENISKLYYKKHLGLRGQPSLEQFLDGIEQFHFGGTCYVNNYYLYRLLVYLGYQVDLCGADMSDQDVHIVCMVTVEGKEYLVDGGYAAPFLEPLPRDMATDYTIVLGRDRYVLKPQDAMGCSRLEKYREGDLKHAYLAKPKPRHIHDFEQAIDDSYRDEATFMNALLLARFYPNRSLVIRNLTVTDSRGTESSVRTLASQDDLPQAVYDNFAIPKKITEEVLKGIGQLRDEWN